MTQNGPPGKGGPVQELNDEFGITAFYPAPAAAAISVRAIEVRP
jgi:hypothetical protein